MCVWILYKSNNIECIILCFVIPSTLLQNDVGEIILVYVCMRGSFILTDI